MIPLRIYVAGPMRGLEEFNFPAFARATALLRDLYGDDGVEVFSPAERDLSNGFDPSGLTGDEDLASLGFDLRDALAVDLDFVARKADMVVVLPGWEDSRGAMAEVATAIALDIPVIPLSEVQDFLAWTVAAETAEALVRFDHGEVGT